MRISDWSSDVCSSDLPDRRAGRGHHRVGLDHVAVLEQRGDPAIDPAVQRADGAVADRAAETEQALLEHIGTRVGSGDMTAAFESDREIGRATSRERVCQYG